MWCQRRCFIYPWLCSCRHRCIWYTINWVWSTNSGCIRKLLVNWVPSSTSSTRPVTIEFITVVQVVVWVTRLKPWAIQVEITGSNKYCLDKNFGAWLIVWDRMFGTFQEELNDVPIVYGLVDPVKSFNPVYLQVNQLICCYLIMTTTNGEQSTWRCFTWRKCSIDGMPWMDGRTRSLPSSKVPDGAPEVRGPDTSTKSLTYQLAAVYSTLISD